RTPMAFVYRTDIARGQLRRRFEGDPAALELSTWATASSVITALRDGWIGVAPPRDSSRHAVHLVGSADWIPALSPDWELHPADRAQLEALPASVTTGVALRDAGGLMTTELQAVARGGQDFATKLDVPKGEHRVEIFPLLDRLDGQAAVGYTVGSHQLDVRVERGGDDDLHSDLGEALDLAGVDASVETDGEDLVVHAPHATALREQVIVTKLGGTPGFSAAMQGAGKPPRPPVLWLWQRGVGCAATSGGWVTYDGGGVLDVSLDVSIAPARTCIAASGAADLATLAMAR
ncbi:MAG: hypothetical protein JWM98_498, partial [Thermoleophilia bacterium]|nr:hypothetical protein [Thermoleophilia bacterium]